MPKHFPRNGLPMWQAMLALYEGKELELLEQFTTLESMLDDLALQGQRRLVWSGIQKRALDNKVQITGIAPGESTERELPRNLVRQSDPNFQKDTLKTAVGIYTSVMIMPVAQAAPAAPANNPPPQAQGSPRLDYRQEDAPFLREMDRLIQNGAAKNVTDAARSLADKAAGKGRPESKRQRLVHHFFRWKKGEPGYE